MDNNTQPVQPSQSGMNESPENKKVGPIIATLLIVLILIIAALYLFAARINQPAIPTDDSGTSEYGDVSGAQSPAAQSVPAVTGTSTDLQSMQSDLDNSTAGLDNQNF